MPSTDEIRATQRACWDEKADQLAQAMSDLNDDFTAGREPFAYHPPESDDWTEWQGLTLWCAIQYRYKWALKRYVDLSSGKGPYYCKAHGEERIEGGRAALCLRCSWDAYVRDEAIAEARELRNIQARQGVAA